MNLQHILFYGILLLFLILRNLVESWEEKLQDIKWNLNLRSGRGGIKGGGKMGQGDKSW